MEVSGREGPGTGSVGVSPVAGAGPSRLDPTVSSGGTATLGDLLLWGLGFGVAGSGLRRTHGLAPNDPKEEVAGLSSLSSLVALIMASEFFCFLSSSVSFPGRHHAFSSYSLSPPSNPVARELVLVDAEAAPPVYGSNMSPKIIEPCTGLPHRAVGIVPHYKSPVGLMGVPIVPPAFMRFERLHLRTVRTSVLGLIPLGLIGKPCASGHCRGHQGRGLSG